MNTAFVVMHIGDPDLDRIYDKAIKPAIESSGMQSKRADQDTEGGLVNNEIIECLISPR